MAATPPWVMALMNSVRVWKGAPQAEPGGVGQVLQFGRSGRGDVDDACVGQRVLQPQTGAALFRRLGLAALAAAAGGVRHGMRLVEDDNAVEAGNRICVFLYFRKAVSAEPFEKLLEP
jgi:hypothetical protein